MKTLTPVKTKALVARSRGSLDKKKQGCSIITLSVLLAVASFFDAAQGAAALVSLFPLMGLPLAVAMNITISASTFIVLVLIFSLKGLGGGLMQGRGFLRTALTFLAEFIPLPFINILPSWTLYAFLSYRSACRGDAAYNKEGEPTDAPPA